MAQIPILTDESFRRMAQQVQRLELQLESVRRQLRATSCELGDARIYVAKSPAGGIDAQAGDTPGSADCTVYSLDSGGDWASAAFTVKVYNMSAEAVAASTYIQCKREAISDVFVADFEKC